LNKLVKKPICKTTTYYLCRNIAILLHLTNSNNKNSTKK
jgi:hypothetical protein